jgi:hypothetical protein
MDEKALTVKQAAPSALDVYGSGEDIQRLARRIKMGVPNGDKLSNDEALTLAQIGLAHKLDIFTGEAWYIPGKGPMIGIRGLRKAARNQSNYWPEFILLDEPAKKQLGIPPAAVAYRCLVFRTDMILQSATVIKAMREAGMKDAVERYAYKPTEGVGYWTPGIQRSTAEGFCESGYRLVGLVFAWAPTREPITLEQAPVLSHCSAACVRPSAGSPIGAPSVSLAEHAKRRLDASPS